MKKELSSGEKKLHDMTELKNLASTCEFGELPDSLLPYKIVDGIRSEKIRYVLLRKGADKTGKSNQHML